MLESLIPDVRLTLRWLLRNPRFTLGAVFSLSIGVGFTTATFALVDAALLRPPPVVEPDRLVYVYTTTTAASGPGSERFGTTSYLDFLDLRAESSLFGGMAGYTAVLGALNTGTRLRLVLGEAVTGNYFRVLGVRAAVGRTLLPEDDAPGAAPVALVSYRYWVRELAGDPRALGQTIRLGGTSYTVVGVAAPEFRGLTPALASDFWVPVTSPDVSPVGIRDVIPSPTGTNRLDRRGERWLFVVGRLREPTTTEQARAHLDVLMARLAAAYPITNKDRHISVLPMRGVRFHPSVDSILRPYAVGLTLLAGLTLLTACANVTSMFLVRAAARQKEIGVRLALGATPGRIARQLLTESLILSSIGAAGGLGLAWWIASNVAAFSLALPIPISLDVPVDHRALVFSVSAAVGVGVLAGLVPCVTTARSSLLPGGDMVIWRTPRQRWTIRDALVSAQMAITVVLLVAAALLARSFFAARTVNLGLPIDRLAVIALDTRMVRYSDTRSEQFFAEALVRIRGIPGVEGVTLASRVPFSPNFNRQPFWIPGRHGFEQPGDLIELTRVSPEYFTTMGVAIVEGRGFTDEDRPDTPRVAVVNETMARRYWPRESPIGKTFRSLGSQGREFQVVGVSADYKVVDVGETLPFIHQARRQQSGSYGAFIARTRGDGATLLREMQRTLLSLEPELVFIENETMAGEVGATLLPVRVGSWIAGGVGLMAMTLAAIGLYGVIAYAVAQRTREIGIRLALGARPSAILRLVMRQGFVIATAGLVIGCSLSVALVVAIRVPLSSVVRGIDIRDSIAWVLATILVLAVSFLATLLPAKRASDIAPFEALRRE